MWTLTASLALLAACLPAPGHGTTPAPGHGTTPASGRHIETLPGRPTQLTAATPATPPPASSGPRSTTPSTSPPSAPRQPSHVLQKCCPRGQYAIRHDTCSPLKPSVGNASDPWWWIASTRRQNLSLDTLTEEEVTYGRKPPCDGRHRVYLSVNDTQLHRLLDGVRLEVYVDTPGGESSHAFSSDNFCLDVGPSGGFALLCPCEELVCLTKCCPLGSVLDPGAGGCVALPEGLDDWMPGFDTRWAIDDRFYVLNGYHQLTFCSMNETRHSVDEKEANLDLILMRDGGIKSRTTDTLYPRDRFCGDRSPTGKEALQTCRPSPPPSSSSSSMSTAMGCLLMVGAFALLLTVLVSCLLPETRKRLHGRVALMHNAVLLVAYVSTGALHLISVRGHISVATSKVFGFVIQFSFLSAFFWLNVMCIDIAVVFRARRPVQGGDLEADRKKFVIYSCYAWGSACLISMVTAAVEFTPGARLRPAFGEDTYFFNNNGAQLLFFYGPMAVLLTANLGLFVYTAVEIKQAATEAAAVLDSADSRMTKRNHRRLAVYARLFTLMGVTWLFEVVSWAVGGDPRAWFPLDAINLLRAVFVFVIFCCNKHVFSLLRQRAQRAQMSLGRATTIS